MYYYLTIAIGTVIAYCTIKTYFQRKRLKQFRRNLHAGQEVLIEYKDEMQPGIIQRHHGELLFCWLNDSGCFIYVEPQSIYPYEY